MQPSALPNEIMLGAWGAFQLSSHRVWTVANDDREGLFMSMPIDAVEAVAIERVHFPLFLMVGVVLLAAAIFIGGSGHDSSGAGVLVGFVGIAVFLGYFVTRKTALAIHAGSASMRGVLSGRHADVGSAMQFLDLVQRQILAARGSSEHIHRAQQSR